MIKAVFSLYLFLISCLLFAREDPQSREIVFSENIRLNKGITVKIHRNIIAFRIAYNLKERNLPWALIPNPVRNNLSMHFSQHKNHEAVKLANDLGYDDMVVTFLLHQKEFPSFGDRYDDQYLYDNDQFYVENKETLTRLYNALFDFYQKAEVEKFINEYIFYYEGAMREIEDAIRQYDVVDQMERYTKIDNREYVVSPEPLFLTGGIRGIGPRVRTDSGTVCYQFISPSNQIDVPKQQANLLKVFGYNDPDYLRKMSVHEFGHSFVNPTFDQEEVKQYILARDSLFTKEIQASLENRGIGNFLVFVIENVVRALEIRIAENYVSSKEAQQLRETNEEFIYIPAMEKILIEQYESRSTIYSDFSEVIPDLIQVIK